MSTNNTIQMRTNKNKKEHFLKPITHAVYVSKAALKVPGIPYHEVTWHFLKESLPGITNANRGIEEEYIMYSYADVLVMVLKQKDRLPGCTGHEWTLYPGGLAWF